MQHRTVIALALVALCGSSVIGSADALPGAAELRPGVFMFPAEDAPDSAASLRHPGAAPAAFGAIASPVDSFLVFSHGFDSVLGGCNTRGWTIDERSNTVWAHVDTKFLVNDGFVSMGSRALWFGTDLATDSAAGRHEAENWIIPSGYGNSWSQRLTSPLFPRPAGHAEMLKFDAKIALRRDFTFTPITAIGLNSGITGAEFVGAQALQSDGTWTHLAGRATINGGPPTWKETPPLFSSFWSAATTGFALNSPRQVAVDAAGNLYVADYNNNRVVKYDRWGTFILTWGVAGSGDGQFSGPIGVAVDRSTNDVYVTDSGNNRVEKFTSAGAFLLKWGGFGTGPGQFDQTQHVAVDAGGHVYVVDQRNHRIEKFTSAGVFEAQLANAALAFPYGIALGADGSIYVTDISLNQILKLNSDGSVRFTWGSLGTGNDNTNVPTGLALDRDGYLWVADQNNNRVLKYDVSGAAQQFLAKIGNNGLSSYNFVSPQGLAITPRGDIYVSEGGRSRIDHWMIAGPVAGYGTFHYEVRLNEDGNQDLSLADPLRLRIVMQTSNINSDEDGNLLAGDDGNVLVDNVTLRQSTAGGAVAEVPDATFEDGTTGSWVRSAQNGYYGASNVMMSIIRDVPPGAPAQVRTEADPNNPTCLWSFTGPSGYLEPGTFCTVVSPWFSKGSTDWANLAIAMSAKFNAQGQAVLCSFRIRGKYSNGTHAVLVNRPPYLFGGAGTSDLEISYSDAFSMPTSDPTFGTFSGPTDVDLVRFEMEVTDQCERRLAIPATAPHPRTKLPVFDDIQAYVTGVDQDFDGVRDSQDAQPTVCAAGRDADGNGAPDVGATLKHLETWAQTDRPIHYTISSQGLPGITDGSDVAALVAGFQAWKDVPGSTLGADVIQDPPTSQTNAISGDAVHLLTFGDDYEFPANVLAVTPTLSYTRRQTFDDRVALPGQIVDADIMFNPRARFYTATQGTRAGGFDLQSVATHEIGHFLGLSHTGVQTATMYPVLQDGENAASLEDDDRAAIVSAYPQPAFATSYGTITGKVTRGSTTTPIPGAFVYAAKIVGGVPTTAGASDYTDETGSYALRRLEPGQTYAVRVIPLDGSLPGLLPGAINAQVQATAETNFQAEWFGGPESNQDDPDVYATFVAGANVTQANVNIQSNVDLTPPTVDTVTPSNLEANVRIDTPIQVTFSEPVQASTLSTAFRLHKLGVTTRLGGTGQLLSSGLTFVFIPSTPLEFDTDYQVEVTTALTDREANPLAITRITGFHTQIPPAVAIAGIEPREAPVGALITLTGAGYDFAAGAQNKVYFQTPGDPVFVLGTLVSATSMVVQVPANAQSGLIKVVNSTGESNQINFSVLTSDVAAPSPNGSAIPLSFQPSDVALAPAGDAMFAVGAGKFARINLDPARPSLRTALETAISGAAHIALVPSGRRAWVTRPDNAASDHANSRVSEVDADPNSATYGQVLGDVALPGYLPSGITIAATGQLAYVSDQSSDRVLELNIDPAAAGSFRTLLREIKVPTALLSGGIVLDPHGRSLYVGTDNLGLLAIDLAVDPPTATTLAATAVGAGVAVTPSGGRVLAVEGGASAHRVVYRDVSPGTGSGLVPVGGEPRAIQVSPGGATAFVVNSQFAQLQVLDVTQATPTQVADVGTGAGPVAVALNSSGTLLAVANASGRSVSLYSIASASVTPVRTAPPVGVPGDRIALQTSGGALDFASRVDVGAGEFAFARVASGGGVFVLPALDQRDANVTLSVGGTRSLSMPFRIMRPIAATVPGATGVMLDPVNAACGPASVDGALGLVRVSPDGRLLAVSRQAPGCFVRLDLYRISTSQGAERFGERLLDGVSWATPGNVLDMAFTPDGHALWASTDGGGLVEIGVNPTAPGFGSALAFGAAQTGVVRAIATDPLGRYMIVSGAPSGSEVQLWSPGRTLVHAVPVSGPVHSLAATPDGHYAVAGGEGRAYFVDLDAASLVATSPLHAQAPPDIVSSVAVSTDGRRALGAFPNGRVAIWMSDPDATPIGTELYFGVPSPGAVADHLVPSPNGHGVLAAGPDGNLVEITPAPGPTGQSPPDVATRSFGQPVRALARTPDGRQLWVANWNDATLAGDVRLFSASEASRLAVLSGGDQVATQGATLTLPIRVQVTNAQGDPEAGAVVRFALTDATQGTLAPGPTRADELTDINGEASIAWTMPATPGGVSLAVSLLGASGAQATVLATSAGPAATTPPEVVEMGPVPGATDINLNTALFVRFSQPVSADPLVARPFTLLQTDAAPGSTPVAVVWTSALSADGRTVFIQPGIPFHPAASCLLDVAAGVTGANGQVSIRAASTAFTVQDPPTLQLASVSPPSGPAGITVTITGEGFDPVPVKNLVRFGSVVTPVTSATSTSIVTTVPPDTPIGNAPISVQVGAGTATGLNYLMLAPRPQPLTLDGGSNARVGVSAIAVTPDGTRGYFTLSTSNSVLAFSLQSRKVVATIPVGLDPQAIAIPADGKRAYVANYGSGDVSVIDIDPSSPTFHSLIQLPGHPIKVGKQPTSLVVAAYGPQLLVLNSGDGTVSIIDAETGNATFDRVTSTASAGSGGKQIVVTPDGTRAYLANAEGIVMLDLRSKAVTTVASSGSGGKQVAISPDGTMLFALIGNGDLLVIDIAPGSVSFNHVVTTAPTGSGGKAVAISPDGTMLYLTLHDNSAVEVFRISTGSGGGPGSGIAPGPVASLHSLGTVPVGTGPEGIAFSPDGSFALVANGASGTISVLAAPTPSGSVVAAQPPASCLTPGLACLAVPVTIERDSVATLLAYSVKLQLSPNLSLCDAQVVEGDYLSSLGTTFFHVVDLGGGALAVDGAILGPGCGATGANGTLFTLHLGSTEPSGTGTVAVTQVLLRDCSNREIPSLAGPVASLTIDNTIPSAITLLAAAQVRTGNGNDGTTRISVSWPAAAPGESVLLYRRGYGNYPEYDDAPSAGAAPEAPAYPPGAAWVPLGTFLSGTTSLVEEPATRDFWYYVAFVRDACGNVSPVSNRTPGTLNYHLGDVANGVTNCAGNNLVDLSDISFLGAHYGATLVDSDPLACLDVGPTTDFSVNARPTTDNRLDFEDLVLFAINYSVGPAAPSSGKVVASGSDEVTLEAPAVVRAGDTVLATVRLSGSGAVHALSIKLGWNTDVLEPLGVESGGFLEAQHGVVLSPGADGVDAAILGAHASGVTGEGPLAVFKFRVRADGNPALVVRSVEGRDADNKTIAVGMAGGPRTVLPTRTLLEAARPNPFVGMTELRFAIAHGGSVNLVVYDVTGRKVRTLVHGERVPGEYQVVWDGRDDTGRATASGIFYVRLSAPGVRTVRTLARMR